MIKSLMLTAWRIISALRLHLLFIVLAQVLYTLVYFFRPQQLNSDWQFFYLGICIFIYLAAGWLIMHETGKRLYAAWAGLMVFIAGYIAQIIGIFLIVPLLRAIPLSVTTTALLKFLHFGVYYALIALALAVVGAHLCRQLQRHRAR